jgi:transcriptional regulator with XRE-family HTH domain
MDDMRTFGERLSWTRLRRGLTRAELSDLCGIATSTIGNLETGHSNTTRKLVELAAALGVSKDWLVSGVGETSALFIPSPEIAEWKVRLREARRKQGITRNDLALMVGVSNSTVTNWEQSAAQGGIKQISEKKAEKVSRALGIKKEWLLYGDASEADGPSRTKDYLDAVERQDEADEMLQVPRVILELVASNEVFKVVERQSVRKLVCIPRDEMMGLEAMLPSLLAVPVEDGGMLPVLCAGDEVVINVADVEKEDQKTFAVNVDGRLLIRRLHLTGGAWKIATLDGTETAEISTKITVVGRVVYRLGSARI